MICDELSNRAREKLEKWERAKEGGIHYLWSFDSDDAELIRSLLSERERLISDQTIDIETINGDRAHSLIRELEAKGYSVTMTPEWKSPNWHWTIRAGKKTAPEPTTQELMMASLIKKERKP